MGNIKSILIGVLATTCLFLFMGQSKSTTQVGRYDIEVFNDGNYYLIYDNIGDKFVEVGFMEYFNGDEKVDPFIGVFRDKELLEVPGQKE